MYAQSQENSKQKGETEVTCQQLLADCKSKHWDSIAWDSLEDQGKLRLKHIMNVEKIIKTCLH